MLHRNRIWSLQSIGTRELLAYKLAHLSWTSCQAFGLEGYIFANDSTDPEGSQEYAVLKAYGNSSHLVQIESVTFSWCSEQRSLDLVKQACIGNFDHQRFGEIARSRFQTDAEHGRCPLCA